MSARTSMATLISSVRVLINDVLPLGSGQVFTDDIIQAVMDEGRVDVFNGHLTEKPTFAGSIIEYLDYFSPEGGWEDDYVIRQYLTVQVTPSFVEPIAGHFQFASNVFPPCYIVGKLHDRYRAAADLLERWAAMQVLNFDVVVGGQSLRRSQPAEALQKLAKTYRMKQRPKTIAMKRSDLAGADQDNALNLEPRNIDYYASGSKNG
jgi:hypothetical protein